MIQTLGVYKLQSGGKARVEYHTRGGSKSPSSMYLVLKGGRRVSPYEARVKGIHLTLNSELTLIYKDSDLKGLMYGDNPWLRRCGAD